MVKKILAVALLILALSSEAGAFGDLFSGTLEIKDGRPYLVRCDLNKNTYLLLGQDGRDYDLKALTKLGVGQKQPMQGTVFGQAAMGAKDNLSLTVERLENVKPGSCHLESLFE